MGNYKKKAFGQDVTPSAKVESKSSTTNNHSYPHTPATTTASTSSVISSYSSSSLGRGDFSKDQIAAALLNGFGGQVLPQLLMEMPSMPRSGQQGQAYQQMAGFPSALVQSKEQTKPEAKQDTVKAERRPPDPGPEPGACIALAHQNGSQLHKVPTPLQVHVLPNIHRPSSSQLYLSQHGFSPDKSPNSWSGPPPAGLNSPGHSSDSNFSIYSPLSIRAPVRDGLLGGQPRGQPVGVEHTPDHTSTTISDSSAIHLPAMQISDYTSYDVTRSCTSDLQDTIGEPTMANVWVKWTIVVN